MTVSHIKTKTRRDLATYDKLNLGGDWDPGEYLLSTHIDRESDHLGKRKIQAEKTRSKRKL